MSCFHELFLCNHAEHTTRIFVPEWFWSFLDRDSHSALVFGPFFLQILTPWREPPAPEKEAFMTFWLTRDALVHVCTDSRTPPGKLPSWLEYAGFRKLPVRCPCELFASPADW